MNFFKSVFSEDDSPTSNDQPEDQNPEPNPSSWTFSSLIKTLATTSESMIGSYRQDIEEIGSVLKNETTVIRQVASRAVKELPHSFEIGASVAQESLESVGQAIDDIGELVWKSTSNMITHGRETLLLSSVGQYDSDSSSVSNSTKGSNSSGTYSENLISDANKRYSRFEMQVRAMQCDVGTYCNQPEDSDEYDKWKLGFAVEEKSGEIDGLIRENGVMNNIFNEFVPSKVEFETFWCRYFYNLHKLKQTEDVRVKLVRRAMAEEEDEEEELSWDCDDDDEEEQVSSSKNDLTQNLYEIENVKEGKDDEKVESRESSCKDSDVSVVSTQPSLCPEGEDLEWDEIEDLGSNDDESKAVGSSNNGVKLLNPVIAVVEDEDLSWDIEDDDELAAKP